jgi:O-acetyl-ADP-ribose deacetylase
MVLLDKSLTQLAQEQPFDAREHPAPMLPPEVRLRVVMGDLVRVPLAGRAAIVNPANSLGLMGGGVAGAIRRAAGERVEQEARARAPVALGQALLTSAGDLPYTGIIHAPTMVQPVSDADAEVVREACRAAVKLAHAERFDAVAFPGMGTGTGGLDVAQAARAMVAGIQAGLGEVAPPPPRDIVLVAYDERLRRAFEEALAEEDVGTGRAATRGLT